MRNKTFVLGNIHWSYQYIPTFAGGWSQQRYFPYIAGKMKKLTSVPLPNDMEPLKKVFVFANIYSRECREDTCSVE